MTPQSPISLYVDRFWISPYVFTAFVALREKGLKFDIQTLSLGDLEQRKPEYADRTLTGRVPAIRHGDFWLAESSAIVEYLEDAFPSPAYPRLLPARVEDRARARQILGWIRSDLMALREERSTATMFYERASTPLSDKGQAAADKLVRVAELLLPAGATSLFGEWSIADSDLAFMLHRLILNGHALPAKIQAFAEAQWQRPSVREFVDNDRPEYVPYSY